MYTLPIKSAKPGMVVYADIYNYKNELVVKSNTQLTYEIINILSRQVLDDTISISEPGEIDMTRYMHLQANPHFQSFCEQYNRSLSKFINMLRTLETGLEFDASKLLSVRNDVMKTVANGEQLIDYLYNMMPGENEITYKHCFDCGLMCYNFGKWLNIAGNDLDNLTLAGFLFDVGKTKLPDDILWKPGKLTPGEYTQVKRHIHMGYELLYGRKLPPHVISVMIMHHERCDSSGYPARIPGERIDPFALIAAVADTYEAMTSPRAQRPALTPFQAIRAFEQQGLEAKYGKNITPILKRIANIYLDRRVCVTVPNAANRTVENSFTLNLEGRIVKVHEDALSRPTVLVGNTEYNMRTNQNAEIIRMI